ncbi:unnamed protein product, partial [Mesorhabditis belari]|uniref:Uncharacterized protein n=1 Tax=Mesorhabditis belari TaxID=2138241 RepID=A0AAF3FGF0_9BILA
MQFLTPNVLRSVAVPGDMILFKRLAYFRNDENGFDVVHVHGSKVNPEQANDREPQLLDRIGSDLDNQIDNVLTPANRALIMERLDKAVSQIPTNSEYDLTETFEYSPGRSSDQEDGGSAKAADRRSYQFYALQIIFF